jgi:hypothetical protein
MVCVTINNQYHITLAFGSLAEVSHCWDENILQPVNKQDFGDESSFAVLTV